MKFKHLAVSLLIGALFAGTSHAQVKIGVVSSSTGPIAMVGIPQKNTVPLMPTKAGGQSIRYIPLDDGSDPTASVVAIKKLISEENVDAIIGPDDAIVYPEGLTKELDYELELAIIIGKSGKFFGPDEANDYIAGFTVFNDISARDIQRKEMESGVFSFSKAIDTFCPIGPWIVTADEVPDMHELAMELRVNGEVRQKGNTNQTRVSFPHLVAYHSPQTYSAGDIITTGTISGVAAVQPNPFDFYLQPGDKIEAEIAGIGTLRNHVVSWQDAYGVPAPQRVDW